MNPLVLLSVLAALVSGMCVALQAPTNAMLGRAAGSPINAALISFAVGTLALLAAALALGVRPSGAGLRGLPFHAWTGGLYGAFFVAAAVFAAPRIGLAFYIALLIGGQLATALLLDHFGALGLERQPISLTRIVGVFAILGGVLLIRR